ncbi:MAG: radical SAM protein [Lentisphaerota bacterium]
MTISDILLITPPFSQFNTPYPATVFLKGFLAKEGFSVNQVDLSIETILKVFSKKGLSNIFSIIESKPDIIPPHHIRMLKSKEKYCSLVDNVISFLQGNNNSYATAICDGILPKGERYKASRNLARLFNKSDINTKAKFLGTIFIEEIGDLITAYIDSNFGFSRYAEQIGISPRFFASVEPKIHHNTLLTDTMCILLDESIKRYAPQTIGFTIPFPGNLLSALKMSHYIKKYYPGIPIIVGGGWVNTELRQLTDPTFFDYVDFVCLDFGERPLLQLLNHLINNESNDRLVRTFVRKNGKVIYHNNETLTDIESENCGTPDYSYLPLDKYISVVEMVNPVHNLWSNGRWNKLLIAQGCYWHKCAFCDTSLDYISKYHAIDIYILCDRIEVLIKQTSHNGFHFVDEAAPPKALRELALELIRRNIKIRWWANIRFESSFTAELCQLLARSGCIAVSGGLEVLSNRLLKMMNKGVTIEQAAKTTHNFSTSGIMVHAYLMYGFPTQTALETVNSLEIVRQLFENRLIQSAYFHRFAMTVHSPIGKNPEKYNVKAVDSSPGSFANNDQPHIDTEGCDHNKFSFGLKKALYNYMHQSCLDYSVKEWFDFKVPKATITPNFIERLIKKA